MINRGTRFVYITLAFAVCMSCRGNTLTNKKSLALRLSFFNIACSGRFPRILLFGELASGRWHEGLNRRFKVQLKSSWIQANINHENWESVDANRPSLRPSRWGVVTFMSNPQREEDLRPAVKRARFAQQRSPPSLLCDSCSRLFGSRLDFHISATASRGEKGNWERGWGS